MYSKDVQTLYKNQNNELIINIKNNQTLLLKRAFSDHVRKSRNFQELKELCNVSGSDFSNLRNTYEFLINNGFLNTTECLAFNDTFYKWQDQAVNFVVALDDVDYVYEFIKNNKLIVNELVIVKARRDEVNENFKSALSNLKKHVAKVTLILGIDRNNASRSFSLVRDIYNMIDEFLFIILEGIDTKLIYPLLNLDINAKFYFQIYIENLLEYRNVFNYFLSNQVYIAHSSQAYCYFYYIEDKNMLDVKHAVIILKNNIHCMGIANYNNSYLTNILPHTIINYKKDLFCTNNQLIETVALNRCECSCMYSCFCPYTSTTQQCEYKKLLNKEFDI